MLKNNNSPRVSVLMPVYKTNELYLREAVESILNQTFTDFEFLILDDCPDDDREQLIKSYKDPRIKYFKNEKNMGISASRNKLVAFAKGEYLAVFDHDDISLPLRLQKQVDFLDCHPAVGIVGTWYERFPNTKIKKRYVLNCQIETDLMYHCSILHPSSMIRKSLFSQHNISYKEEFSPAEDYALWGDFLEKTEFANIPEVLFRYRDYSDNTSKKQIDKMKSAQKNVQDLLHKKHPYLWQQANNKQSLHLFGLPLLTKQTKGCHSIYKIFGKIKVKTKQNIFLNDYSDIPVYIISFNRLSYLKQMIEWLRKRHFTNIHIIDNCSTYPPLLEYLHSCPYQVHYMEKNEGHLVFFKSERFNEIRQNQYYVLTDPDIALPDECPTDFMNLFYDLLQKYPNINKVGFSLRTQDIPDFNIFKEVICSWEKQFYRFRLNYFKPYFYKSSLDTTFALYRPEKLQKNKDFFAAIRTGSPYEALHLPWYKNLSELSEEDVFYNNLNCGSGTWNDKDNLQKIVLQLQSKNIFPWYERLFSIKTSDKGKILRIAGFKITLKKSSQCNI